jgi:carbonic anhydrase
MKDIADRCRCASHDRRALIRLGGAAALTLGCGVLAPVAHAVVLSKAQRDAMSPEQILELMKKGNERFRKSRRETRDFLAQQRATAKGQYPAAILLSCIDSRAPAETIMDLGIGDVFNARVAGNVANDDMLGSMEFACKVAGAKVVLVMGHTACGAIKGAIDNAELGNLTGLLAKIKPAVAATEYAGDRTSRNYAFVDAVARKNVELTMSGVRKDSPVLAGMESSGTIKIAGAMYDLQTGVIDFLGG